MRPISLADEDLDDLDLDDLKEFSRSGSDHGKRKEPHRKDDASDLFDDPESDEEILDLVTLMDAGVVDYE